MRRSGIHAAHGDTREAQLELTPMLDVVFILLIFFIVTATFIKEAGIQVSRPDAETSIPKPRVSVIVAVSESGEIWVDKKRVSPAAVRAHIERMHAENPMGGIVIQADRKSKYEALKAVLDAARAAGVTEVAVSTES